MEKTNLASYITYNPEQFTKRIVFKNQNSTAFVLNFQPGQTLPTHTHPGSIVYLYVITGKGTFVIDDEPTAVVAEDLITVTGKEALAFSNDSNLNTSLYVVLTSIPSEDYVQDR